MSELPQVPINGNGVVLRLPREDDAADVVAACSDPETVRFLPMVPEPYAIEDAMLWMNTIAAANRAAGGATFAIADPTNDRLIGSIGANGSRLGGYATSVGYWVAPWARSTGVATNATRTIVSWLFEQGFGRIELTTDLANEVSQRVAVAAGFRHEGIRRAISPQRDGSRHDVAVWTRLASDSGERLARLLPDLPAGGLTDGVVTLERLGLRDLDDLHALHTTPDVAARSVRPVPRREETAERCAEAAYKWLTGAGAEFVIRDAVTGAFAGDIGLFQVHLGQGMIGYSLSPEWRGRAYAARAARLVTDWCFDQVGLVRVVAGTAPDNIASQRTLAKVGFQREGYERSRLPGPAEARVDNVAFAILAADRG
jgi:RimJ/RimL family protein N-acetyltransferase